MLTLDKFGASFLSLFSFLSFSATTRWRHRLVLLFQRHLAVVVGNLKDRVMAKMVVDRYTAVIIVIVKDVVVVTPVNSFNVKLTVLRTKTGFMLFCPPTTMYGWVIRTLKIGENGCQQHFRLFVKREKNYLGGGWNLLNFVHNINLLTKIRQS